LWRACSCTPIIAPLLVIDNATYGQTPSGLEVSQEAADTSLLFFRCEQCHSTATSSVNTPAPLTTAPAHIACPTLQARRQLLEHRLSALVAAATRRERGLAVTAAQREGLHGMEALIAEGTAQVRCCALGVCV
jgi:hypothetical protein